MTSDPRDRGDTGRMTVVVITVWSEPGIDGVRARVTALPTAASGLEVSRVTSSVDEALVIARHWLQVPGDDAVTSP